MERVAILGDSEVVTPEMIRGWIQLPQDDGQAEDDESPLKCNTLAEMERKMIEKTLEKFSGHRIKTAQSLGIGVRTLGMKLKRWRTEQSSCV